MRTFRYLAALGGGACLLAVTALPAAATAAPHAVPAAGGTTTLMLASGTTAVFGGISCTASSLTLTSASAAAATISVPKWTLTSCSTDIEGTTSASITVDSLPYSGAVSDGVLTLTGASGSPVDFAVTLGTIAGNVSCGYAADSLTGTISAGDKSVTFSDQEFTLASGPGLCPKDSAFSAMYG